MSSDPAIAMANHIANNLPNNAHAITNNVKHEKNVNIDRFKLGNNSSVVDQDASNAGDCSSSRGACALQVDEIEQEENEILEDISEPKNFNINVFDAEESPSKVKNNFILEKQEKITKANVDLVFNRNDWTSKDDLETEGDDTENLDEDEIAIAKMTTYLKH